jgi:transposase
MPPKPEVVLTRPIREALELRVRSRSRRRVQHFLADHPKVHLHFTPTYSSWLNQVANWFSKIERDLIARGIFTSKGDLARKIMRYIKHHKVAPKPIRWTYSNPERRIPDISSTVTVY